MSGLQIIGSYLKYLWNSKSIHAAHSPFLFQLLDHLKKAKPFLHFRKIENERNKLRNDHRVVEGIDFGAGSRSSLRQNQVSNIAKTSLKPKKQAELLFHLANYFASKNILELGTSLGISTSYLATATEGSRVLSLEGNDQVIEIAKKVFQDLDLNNIEILSGNIDETLRDAFSNMPKPDFVFLDANHKKEPCLRYFKTVLDHSQNDTVIVIDDIHWSDGMEEAWEEIKQNDDVKLTVDLFHFGLVFLRKELSKQDFTIRL